MIGFETIGNATVTCFDGPPVLTTDPWIIGDAYFGSWGMAYAVPRPQLENVQGASFIWLSHGHPDHTNAASLDGLAGKTILLPDHVGGRMARDLRGLGFLVQVMPDRTWVPLSRNIRAMCISDYNQDAILLIDVGGRLLVNCNDAVERGWGRFVKKIISSYRVSFLLKLFGYGDVDMINIVREDGSRLLPPPPTASVEWKQYWDDYLAAKVKFWTNYFGTTYLIPFSMFHAYQRADSVWAHAYMTPLSQILKTHVDRGEVLPAFIRYDCENDILDAMFPDRLHYDPRDPKDFGDDWSELLEQDDIRQLRYYFQSIGFLRDHLDFVRFRVGSAEHLIELNSDQANHRGLTFEAPRGSLMSAVRYNTFDDVLIGNYMKTTIHGEWGGALAPNVLYPHLTPFVARYADNGDVRTHEELTEYFRVYRARAPFDYVVHRFEHEGVQKLRSLIRPGSRLFRMATRTYSFLKAK